MGIEESARAIENAAEGADGLLKRYGPKVGVTDPSQLGQQGRQCLLWLKLIGAVEGFPKAEEWAKEGAKRWCGKGGPGLEIVRLALKEHQSYSRQALPAQVQRLLWDAAKWTALGLAAGALLVPSLAVP